MDTKIEDQKKIIEVQELKIHTLEENGLKQRQAILQLQKISQNIKTLPLDEIN